MDSGQDERRVNGNMDAGQDERGWKMKGNMNSGQDGKGKTTNCISDEMMKGSIGLSVMYISLSK